MRYLDRTFQCEKLLGQIDDYRNSFVPIALLFDFKKSATLFIYVDCSMLINTGQNNTVEEENEGNMRFKFAFQWYGQPRNLAIFFKTPACCRTLRTESTIMDKSLGTNLHLWGFFTRAKQIHLHLFSPSLPPPTMLDTCTRYFSRVSTLYWGWRGEARILKRITVLF